MSTGIVTARVTNHKNNGGFPSGSRIEALDALRQIAAFIVLVQHFFVIFELETPSWMRSGVFDAKAAVTLFFVLSGYVLALSLRKEPISVRSYINFGIRRILRLYPMHCAATVLAFVVLHWVKNQGGFPRDFETPIEFLKTDDAYQWALQFTLVMPGMRSSFANPPVWTLMTEAKVAIVFPFIAWAILKMSPKHACVFVAVLILGSDWSGRHIVGTAALLGQFALGALIARTPSCMFTTMKRKHWTAWIILSLALYSAASFRYWTPNIWVAYYACSFGAAGIIIATLYSEWVHAKLASLQELIGVDISYGIYILHFPIMLGLKKVFEQDSLNTLVFAVFVLAVLLTISLSIILMHAIERPAIRIGKIVTKR